MSSTNSLVFSAAFLLLAGALPAFGQVIVPGRCPDLPVVQNFDIPAYLGTWYEISKTFQRNEINGTCNTAEYSDFGNGSVRVFNSLINARTGELDSALGSARPAEPSKAEAKLLVNFPFVGTQESPYWVLDTDYSDYSIVWSCRDAPDFVNSLQVYWFLARSRTPSDRTRGFVEGFLSARNFDLSLMEETVQTNCGNATNSIL